MALSFPYVMLIFSGAALLLMEGMKRVMKALQERADAQFLGQMQDAYQNLGRHTLVLKLFFSFAVLWSFQEFLS